MIGMAIGGVGTVMSVAGAIIGGKAKRRIGEMNAQLYENQAKYIQEATAEKLRRHDLNTKRLLGAQQAGYAASGVRTGEGSPLEVLYQTATELNTEKRWIEKSGMREAEMATLQARITRVAGKAAQTASYYEAGANAIGGITSIMRGAGTSFA